MPDTHGGEGEAVKGQHCPLGGRHELPEHCRRTALPHAHAADIGFAVGYVSRFMAEPREDHLAAVKHLLRYVAGTRNYGLVYPRRSRGELELIGVQRQRHGGRC